jgi:hypothetical protein
MLSTTAPCIRIVNTGQERTQYCHTSKKKLHKKLSMPRQSTCLLGEPALFDDRSAGLLHRRRSSPTHAAEDTKGQYLKHNQEIERNHRHTCLKNRFLDQPLSHVRSADVEMQAAAAGARGVSIGLRHGVASGSDCSMRSDQWLRRMECCCTPVAGAALPYWPHSTVTVP